MHAYDLNSKFFEDSQSVFLGSGVWSGPRSSREMGNESKNRKNDKNSERETIESKSKHHGTVPKS